MRQWTSIVLAAVFMMLIGRLFAPTARGAEATGVETSGRPTRKKLLERQIRAARSHRQPRNAPVRLAADTLAYDPSTHTYTLSGSARLVYGPTTLEADKITFRGLLGHAVGHVHLNDPSSDTRATAASFDLRQETATLDDANLFALNHYYLTGKKLEKFPGQRYVASDASLTTCTCGSGTPDWGIRAKRLDVDLGGTARVRSAAFDILGHPVIPIPIAEYNTDIERHSGFLTPRVSESTLNGFEFHQPYFLDISRSQDLTAQFDLDSSTRIGGQLEYRLRNGEEDYLSLTGSYFNESIRSEQNRRTSISDPQIANPTIPIDRWGLVGNIQEHLSPGSFAYGNIFYGSDNLFFREIPEVALSREYGWNSGLWQTARDAISTVGLVNEFSNSYLQLQGIWNQDLIQRQAFALQTLPGALWSGFQSILDGAAYLNYNASAVYYFRQHGVQGWRFGVNPALTVPWSWSRYLDGWATVGVDAATYDAAGRRINVIPVGTDGLQYNNSLQLGASVPSGLRARVIPESNFGLRSALVGTAPFDHFGIGEIETLTQPFVQYSYIPNIAQRQFPLFDSEDRIESRSLIDYGATLRIFTRSSGGLESDAMGRSDQAMLGPNFTDVNGDSIHELLRFTLEQAYDTSYSVAPDGPHLSDVAFQTWVFPAKLVSAGATVDWSQHPQRLDAATVSLLFQPPGQLAPSIYTGRALQGSFVQLSYSYVAPHAVLIPVASPNRISAVSLRTYMGLLKELGIYFAPLYDLSASRLIASTSGIRLKSSCDCWFFDFAINQTYFPRNTSFAFQLTLGGAGSIGGSPFGSNPFQEMGLVPTRAALPAF